MAPIYEFQSTYDLLSEFHQDWSDDYSDEDALVMAYVAANRHDPRCKASALLFEIEELLALEQTIRDQATDYLWESTQCAVALDSQARAAWLKHVAVLVRDGLVMQPDSTANMAWYLSRQASLQTTLGKITDIIRLNPKNAQSYLRRAQIYSELGFVCRAIAEEARDEPTEQPAIESAQSKEALEAYQNALNDYDTAHGLDPDIASDALLGRGSVQMALQNYHGAISDFEEAIHGKPSCRGHACLAEAHQAAGNLQASLENYSQVVGLSHLPDLAYCARGHVYAQLGKYNCALEDYSRAIEMTRHLGLAYYLRADVYEKLGSDELAVIDKQLVSKLFYEPDASWKLTDDWASLVPLSYQPPASS